MSKDNNTTRFIDFIISRGVYDFFIGLDFTMEALNELLFKPKSRNDVSQYIKNYVQIDDISATADTLLSSLDHKEIEKLKFKLNVDTTKIIYKKLINFNNLISVSGLSSKVGSTYIILNIAYFLSHGDNKDMKVAIVDLTKNQNLKKINIGYPKAKHENSFRYSSIDFYYDIDINILTAQNIYHYIILDIGYINKIEDKLINVFFNSFIRILVTHTNIWDVDILLETIKSQNVSFKDIVLFSNLSSEDNYKFLKNTFFDFKNIYNIKYFEGLSSKNNSIIYNRIFKDIIIEKHEGKSLLDGFMGFIDKFKNLKTQ